MWQKGQVLIKRHAVRVSSDQSLFYLSLHKTGFSRWRHCLPIISDVLLSAGLSRAAAQPESFYRHKYTPPGHPGFKYNITYVETVIKDCLVKCHRRFTCDVIRSDIKSEKYHWETEKSHWITHVINTRSIIANFIRVLCRFMPDLSDCYNVMHRCLNS